MGPEECDFKENSLCCECQEEILAHGSPSVMQEGGLCPRSHGSQGWMWAWGRAGGSGGIPAAAVPSPWQPLLPGQHKPPGSPRGLRAAPGLRAEMFCRVPSVSSRCNSCGHHQLPELQPPWSPSGRACWKQGESWPEDGIDVTS